MQRYSSEQQSGDSAIVACRQLRSNDKDRRTYLCLELSGNSNVEELIDAMAANTTVDSLDIALRASFAHNVHFRRLSTGLFQAAGALPKLRTLKIRRIRSRNHAHPALRSVQALTQSLLAPNNRIEELFLSRLELHGSPADFEALGNALRGCQSLKTCRFYDCHLGQGEIDSTRMLDPVARGLSEIPTLEKLDLVSHEEGFLGTLAGEVLGRFGTFPSLESFVLKTYMLEDSHVVAMATAAVASTTLQELILGECCLTTLGFRALATMLQGGASRIVKLTLHLEHENDNGLLEVIQVLPDNIHLTKLILKGRLSKDSESAFIEMIKTNHKLQTLNLENSDISVQRTTRFYVTLNNAGRQHLLGNENATREHWLQALHYVNQDLDSLFYFLIRNPSLCSVDT